MKSNKYILEHGMCGSGYCGAEWLHSTTDIIKEVGSIHYKPETIIEFEPITHYNGNDFYTLYENDCGYYPSADIEINFNNWINTKRGKDKKQIYVFVGESAIGKSFIAHNTNLKVFETDTSLENIESLDYDILVLGNKHNLKIIDVELMLNYNEDSNFDLVQVEFTKLF